MSFNEGSDAKEENPDSTRNQARMPHPGHQAALQVLDVAEALPLQLRCILARPQTGSAAK